MLPNLQLIIFFIDFILKIFKIVLIYHFIINNLIVYYIAIISNTLNKIVNNIKLKVVKS